MTVHYFTFGQQYRAPGTHPAGDAAHPDGWWEVHGHTEAEAREMVERDSVGEWSFAYTDVNFDRDKYPLGALRIYTPAGVVNALKVKGSIARMRASHPASEEGS